jgi:16S rRNA (guanine527-N7)-methyltransferase
MNMAARPTEGGDLESPPSAAVSALFGERSPLAANFAEHLATSAVTRGLIGPRELPRLWSRHILNCAALAPVLPHRASVVDVGSGAGLPGLALAIARPDVEVLLVEPLLRRVAWLEEVVGALELGNVRIVRARAEELPAAVADVATARAVAPLERLATWCLPLVRTGGVMLAIKGRAAREELSAAEPVLRSHGATSWRVLELGGEVLAEPTVVVEVEAGATRPAGRAVSGPEAARTAQGGPRREKRQRMRR